MWLLTERLKALELDTMQLRSGMGLSWLLVSCGLREGGSAILLLRREDLKGDLAQMRRLSLCQDDKGLKNWLKEQTCKAAQQSPDMDIEHAVRHDA
jgi:hypothetical protein